MKLIREAFCKVLIFLLICVGIRALAPLFERIGGCLFWGLKHLWGLFQGVSRLLFQKLYRILCSKSYISHQCSPSPSF